jgi:ABC-type multidrug transport system permease subunit
VARLLPLTYAVEALRAATGGGSWAAAWFDLLALLVFAAALFALSVRTLSRRLG